VLTSRAKVALVAAVLLGVAGRIFGLEVLFGLAAAILAGVGLGCWYALASRAVELAVTPSVDALTIEVGGVATVRIAIENRGPRRSPEAVLCCSVGSGDAHARDQVIEVPPLERGSGARASFAVPSAERGAVRLWQWSLRFEDPLGVARWQVRLPGELEVSVIPKTEPLGQVVASAGRSRERDAASAATSQAGSGLVGLRPYVTGDDLRRIHWPTTARAGSLIVREGADSQAPSAARSTIVVDVRRPAASASYRRGSDPARRSRPFGWLATASRASGRERPPELRAKDATAEIETFERVVSVAASLVRAACRPSSSLRLMLSSGVDTGAVLGALAESALLAELARVVPTEGGSLAPALAKLGREDDHAGGTVIVITTTATAPEELAALNPRRVSSDVVVVLSDVVEARMGQRASSADVGQPTPGSLPEQSETDEVSDRAEQRWLSWQSAGADRMGAKRRRVVFAGPGLPLALAFARDLGEDGLFEPTTADTGRFGPRAAQRRWRHDLEAMASPTGAPTSPGGN
jgi:uncharacterized protein (DUF58 family)